MLAAPRLALGILCALVFSACSTTNEKRLTQPVEHIAAARDPSFRQELNTLLGPSLVGGNRITTLQNGDEIFPAMLAGIRSAKKTITFETYIFTDGEVAKAFAQALAERARAGVRVSVILDAQGSRGAGRENLRVMREAGVDLHKYHTIFALDPRRYNHRTHRKLLVIDGKTGFIGGVGIADQWSGNADSPEHWRDTHYRVEGPVVAEMQAAFMDNWLKTRGALLHGPDYFPAPENRGPVLAQVFGSSPSEGSINVILMDQLAIAAATRSVKLEHAYFVPDRQLMRVLCDAARRGVDVQIITPGRHIDTKIVRHASRARWPELLRAGVKIYEYQPTMIHCKLLIVDGIFTSVGSANFDNRSLRINDEANMNVLDAGFAAQQSAMFERDKTKCLPARLNASGTRALVSAPAQTVGTVASPQL